jgi:hypothetical protein
MDRFREKHFQKASFLRDGIVILGLCLNQAAACLACFVWKLEIVYYLLVVAFFTLIFSLYIRNLTKSVAYSATSVVVGALVGLGIVLIPPLVYGSQQTVDATSTFYLTYVSSRAILSLVVSTFTSIIGSFLIGAV